MTPSPLIPPYLLEIALVVPSNLPKGVTTELLQQHLRELEGDDALRDDGGGRDRAHVGALDVAERFFLRLQVHRMKRAHQRRERLECDTDDERRAARHAAFGA